MKNNTKNLVNILIGNPILKNNFNKYDNKFVKILKIKRNNNDI